MENRPGSIKDIFEEAEECGRTSLELLRLKALDISSDFLASCASQLIVAFILFLFILMLSIGAAFWAGDLLGKPSYGFFIVSAFYVIILLLLCLFLGKHIKRYVSNLIIRQAIKKDL
ncbi:MAG: hypothetical protein JW944_01015 [Deltaproteobacteria bacterium]|nr:hypothetical protein [Deltaproteobacteria bacterium]